MEIVVRPLTEEEVLAATQDEATAELIEKDIETKAQCCVDHLCGCK